MSARGSSRARTRGVPKGQGGGARSGMLNPFAAALALASELKDALDPSKAPGPVKRFTPDEIKRLNGLLKKEGA